MAKTKQISKNRDAEVTKKLILDAAEEEFARAGLVGARTEDIASAADCTRAMIHYYFECKENLYKTVLERLFENQVKASQTFDIHQDKPDVALERFVRFILNDLITHQNLPAILIFEGIQNEGRFYKNIVISAIYRPLEAILERGKEDGTFRKLDALQTAVNIIGMSTFYVLARKNISHLFEGNPDMMSKDLVETHIEEVIEMMLRGVVA